MGCCTSVLGSGLFIDQVEALEGNIYCSAGSAQRFSGLISGEFRMLNNTVADINAVLAVGEDKLKPSAPLHVKAYHESVDLDTVKTLEKRLRIPITAPVGTTVVAAKYDRQVEVASGEQLLSTKLVLHDRRGYELTVLLKPFGSPPTSCTLTLTAHKGDRIEHNATQGSVAIVDPKGSSLTTKHVIWTTKGPFSAHNGPSCKFTVWYAKPLPPGTTGPDAVEPIRLRSEGQGMPFSDIRVRSCTVPGKILKWVRYTTSVNVVIHLDSGVINAPSSPTAAPSDPPLSSPQPSPAAVDGPTVSAVPAIVADALNSTVRSDEHTGSADTGDNVVAPELTRVQE